MEDKHFQFPHFFHSMSAVVITSVIAGIGVFGLIFVAFGAGLDWKTQDTIYEGISIGPYDVSGLTKIEAQDLLNEWHDEWSKDELHYALYDEQGDKISNLDFYPLIVNLDSQASYAFIEFDIAESVDNAFAIGRSESVADRVKNQISLRFSPVNIDPVIHFDKEQFRITFALELKEFQEEPEDAKFDWSGNTTLPEVTSEKPGQTFNYLEAIEKTHAQLLTFKNERIRLERSDVDPRISKADLEPLLDQVTEMEKGFPLDITYFDPLIDFERDFTVSWQEVKASLQPQFDEETQELRLAFVESETLDPLFEKIGKFVEVDSQNAKFEITEENVVKEFVPSRSGYQINREVMRARFVNAVFAEEDERKPVELIVDTIDPEVSTQDVNDLGIKEVLGVGFSDFSGSPRNRIANIRVATEKLNGRLIMPDEEFSLLNALKPFTGANGYLPELVIKGDQIIPEIGGGLCQIGSTMFRSAMKSGLEITERRNHSLVVGYYNDHRNGNPGTDASIYDPAPDFRFKNDTGHAILITTNMDVQTGSLTFTMWGTSDGRKADYSEPIVHRWIPAGETKYVDSEDLAPGEENCQGAHPGAYASFFYRIERSDGTTDEIEYTSSYRALPRICLVGIDPDAPEEGESEEGSDSELEQDSIGLEEEISETPDTGLDEKEEVEA